MFDGRSRGPKLSKWTKASQASFQSFFARRSEPLKAAADDQPVMTAGALKWMFSSFGDEPRQLRADVGAPIRSVVLRLTGTLVALGVGEAPGQGTCERFWVVDEREVHEGTDGASARVRGGTGDLQLRMADGTLAWFSGAHCRPLISEDGALPAGLTDALPPPLMAASQCELPLCPPSPPPALRSAYPLPDAVRPAAACEHRAPVPVACAITAIRSAQRSTV